MTCKDCCGTGAYEIRNAYKPSFKKVVKCDSCSGTSVDGVRIKYPVPEKNSN